MSIGSACGDKPVCRLVGKEWVISGDPYVLTRLLTIFPLSSRSKYDDSAVSIPATAEQSRDLVWFMQRYPMEVKERVKMRTLAASYELQKSRAQAILQEGYKGEAVKFTRGRAPRDYQTVAADLWKSMGGLLLADDLGLGKTVSAITAFTDPALRPAVVVCPPHLCLQWRNAINSFTPELMTHIIKDTSGYSPYVVIDCKHCHARIDQVYQLHARRRRCPTCGTPVPVDAKVHPADVYVLSYSKIKGWPDVLAKVCRSVVFDEVHWLRGGEETERWKSASRLARRMDYRMGMSATPFANLGGESFNVFECLTPGTFGTMEQFQMTWCVGVSKVKAPRLRDPEAFSNYLKERNLMLRRRAIDLGLPTHDCEIIHQSVEADSEAFDEATTQAEELAKVILDDAVGDRSKLGMASMQFDNAMRQATGIAKVKSVIDMVREFCEQGEKVVVFAWHKRVHELLMEGLQDFFPVRYTGSETREQKDAALNRFVTDEDTQVFIMSLRAGEGLDGLQFASCTAVVAELDWTWAVLQQNVGRIARSGQTRPCKAYFPVTDFGSDPIVSQVLGIKKDQLNGFLGDKVATGPKHSTNAEAIKLMAKKFLATRNSV